jgi:hypothetical protein
MSQNNEISILEKVDLEKRYSSYISDTSSEELPVADEEETKEELPVVDEEETKDELPVVDEEETKEELPVVVEEEETKEELLSIEKEIVKELIIKIEEEINEDKTQIKEPQNKDLQPIKNNINTKKQSNRFCCIC